MLLFQRLSDSGPNKASWTSHPILIQRRALDFKLKQLILLALHLSQVQLDNTSQDKSGLAQAPHFNESKLAHDWKETERLNYARFVMYEKSPRKEKNKQGNPKWLLQLEVWILNGWLLPFHLSKSNKNGKFNPIPSITYATLCAFMSINKKN